MPAINIPAITIAAPAAGLLRDKVQGILKANDPKRTATTASDEEVQAWVEAVVESLVQQESDDRHRRNNAPPKVKLR